MKEVVTMWGNTRMVILTALCAAIYAVARIPAIPIIPSFTEIRPGAVFPLVFGLLFGPAGAWGAAIGNVIGDYFLAMLGIGSIFGFVGNFYLAFVMYKLWGATGLVPADDMTPAVNTWRKAAAFVVCSAVASAVCAVVIAGCLDMAGVLPFAFLAVTIAINNALCGLALGLILMRALAPFVRRIGLLWTDVMRPEDVAPGCGRHAGAALMAVGGFGGLIAGLGVGVGLYGQKIMAFAGASKTAGAWVGLLPFLALIVLSGFMLSGREQFGADSTPNERYTCRETRV